MPDKSRVVACIALMAMLAFTISCEAAFAGPQHRKMLQQWYRSTNRNNRLNDIVSNTVAAQASTSQAITEAVNRGGSFGSTTRAVAVGVSGSWAASRGNDVFQVVDRYNNGYGKRRQ
ncbi:hypothetical protein COO60DRAFT_1479461 [Scenedesmus sp. NREL 46B-D3]|nr:hypothetical protein COO60DRAFT_1479461 [Scenedesmus sp. NREL 46B-D3]